MILAVRFGRDEPIYQLLEDGLRIQILLRLIDDQRATAVVQRQVGTDQKR
jgi:hypothetical protein